MKRSHQIIARIACAIGILSFAATTGLGQDFLTNGLVGYYPFSGNTIDASGNGNDGIATGGSLAEDRFGRPSQAYQFSSDGDRITTVAANGFPISTNDFTLSFWVNVSLDNGLHQIFICNQGSEQFQIHIGPLQGPQTQIGFQTGGTGTTEGGYTAFIPWAIGRWYHVEAVRAQGTNIMIFRDGIQLSQQSISRGNDAAPADRVLTFGHRDASPARQFYGLLDDIRIYNRALSAVELQALHDYESGPTLDLIKAVKPSFLHLAIGTNYQLQLSGDAIAWTNEGSPFTATNTNMVYPQYWDVSNWNQLFFRLKILP